MAQRAMQSQNSRLFPGVVYQFLSPERELVLIDLAYRRYSRWALEQLVLAHRALVERMAINSASRIAPNKDEIYPTAKDLFGEGVAGLMTSAKTFDPEKGFRFSTHVRWGIKGAIQNYIEDNTGPGLRLSMSNQPKKLFYNLNRLKMEMGIATDRALSPCEVRAIATNLQVTLENVELMESFLRARSVSLDTPLSADENSGTLHDLLQSNDPLPDEILMDADVGDRREMFLHVAVSLLEPRSQDIFRQRHLVDEPVTLVALGEQYGISGERIRQIEERAVTSVGKNVRALAAGETTINQLLQKASEDAAIRKGGPTAKPKLPSSNSPDAPNPMPPLG